VSRTIGNIYLAWRKGVGTRRYIVGVIKRNATEGVRFVYQRESLEKAQADGFVPYTEFPYTDKEYSEGVLDKFSQRLTRPERADYSHFIKFWEVPEQKKTDVFYLLAHTQGFSPTDNFEFLANFNPTTTLCFVSDLAGLSIYQINKEMLKIGDELRYEKETSNAYDKYAVKVFKGEIFLGYIKKIHSRTFYKKGADRLKIKVKGVDANGTIRKLFIRIYSDKEGN
jgi:hypothetical protein